MANQSRPRYVQRNQGSMDTLPGSYLTQRQADYMENRDWPTNGRRLDEAYSDFYRAMDEDRKLREGARLF